MFDRTLIRFFRRFTIKRKLIVIIMTISSFALLIAGTAVITYDYISYKNNMVRDLNILAEVIGTNSTAALEFNDDEAATEILSAVKAKKNINAACIYTIDGEILSIYNRDTDHRFDFPTRPKTNFYKFRDDRLVLFQAISLDHKKIGFIYLVSNLNELYTREKRYAVIYLAILGISLFAAFLATTKLQKFISRPILKLADMAKVVSDKSDYSVRAVRQSRDELGFLTKRFNEMLKQIEERENALKEAHNSLEKKAVELKRELLERKRFEKALIESEERFRDLFDFAPDMYIILDPEGHIIDFNKRGLEKFGYALEELTGNHLKTVVYQKDHSKVERFIRQTQKSGKPPQNVDVRLINKAGKILWVSIEFSLLKSVEEEIQFIRIICRDITEKKKLQEELERAQRLESAGRIAGQIAHDFNNLLGPLAAYPMLIREDLPEEHPVLEMVTEMEHAAKKIADINQQLLALGRRGHYPMEQINLNALIQNIVSTQFRLKRNRIKLDLQPDLLPMKGGAAQLTRALTNIVLNANEAIQEDGGINISSKNIYLDKPIVGYQTVKRGEYIQLKITDDGSGIKPENINKIFDPFFTTKTMDRLRGSGLGLSVVHGVMEDHKGYITVESEPKKGTTFTLYFPVTREIENELVKAVEKIKGGKESILIVDDDPIQRRVTSQLLNRLGYDIHTVTSGEQAIEYLKNDPQDLVILDMVMDGIDGTETYQRILKFTPQQRAIVLSGYAMTKRVQKALKLGAGSFVPKPISLRSLATAVRKELDSTKKQKVNIVENENNEKISQL